MTAYETWADADLEARSLAGDPDATAELLARLNGTKALIGRVAGTFRSFNAPSVRFIPREHPRDNQGRFIDTPDVTLPDGTHGIAISESGGVVTVAKPTGAVIKVPEANLHAPAANAPRAGAPVPPPAPGPLHPAAPLPSPVVPDPAADAFVQRQVAALAALADKYDLTNPEDRASFRSDVAQHFADTRQRGPHVDNLIAAIGAANADRSRGPWRQIADAIIAQRSAAPLPSPVAVTPFLDVRYEEGEGRVYATIPVDQYRGTPQQLELDPKDPNRALIGMLRWSLTDEPPTVIAVTVDENYRRQGIATSMLDMAKSKQHDLQHDNVLTGDGAAFAAAAPLPSPVVAAPTLNLRVPDPGEVAGADTEAARRQWRIYTTSDGRQYQLHATLAGTRIEAYDVPFQVGELTWSRGEIDRVWVAPQNQRQGIASAMLAMARDLNPGTSIGHSTVLTPDGAAWADVMPSPVVPGYPDRNDGKPLTATQREVIDRIRAGQYHGTTTQTIRAMMRLGLVDHVSPGVGHPRDYHVTGDPLPTVTRPEPRPVGTVTAATDGTPVAHVAAVVDGVEFQVSTNDTYSIPDAARPQIAATIAEVMGDFPNAPMPYVDAGLSETNGAMAAAGGWPNPHISIGEAFLDDAKTQAYSDSWKGMSIGGGLPVDEARHAILVHEMGHNLHRQMRNDPEAGPAVSALVNEQVTLAGLGYGSGTGDQAPGRVVTRWKQDALPTDPTNPATSQSVYANENENEWFAEAFADGYLHGDQASESGKRALAIARHYLGGSSDTGSANQGTGRPSGTVETGFAPPVAGVFAPQPGTPLERLHALALFAVPGPTMNGDVGKHVNDAVTALNAGDTAAADRALTAAETVAADRATPDLLNNADARKQYGIVVGKIDAAVAAAPPAATPAAVPSADVLPPPMGTAPIPDGAIRLYHQTWERYVPNIRANGLLEAQARGDGGQGAGNEPSAGVWAATGHPNGTDLNGPGPDSERAVVEFWATPQQISDRADSIGSMTPAEFSAGYHHVIMRGDVPPDQIVAIHEPWHSAVRYLTDTKQGVDAVLAGEYDYARAESPQYAKAIDYIKAHPDEFAAAPLPSPVATDAAGYIAGYVGRVVGGAIRPTPHGSHADHLRDTSPMGRADDLINDRTTTDMRFADVRPGDIVWERSSDGVTEAFQLRAVPIDPQPHWVALDDGRVMAGLGYEPTDVVHIIRGETATWPMPNDYDEDMPLPTAMFETILTGLFEAGAAINPLPKDREPTQIIREIPASTRGGLAIPKRFRPVPRVPGIHERLVDNKPDRPLSDPAVTTELASIIPDAGYTPYADLPFLPQMHQDMGIDANTAEVGDYNRARHALFADADLVNVPVAGLVVTQERVNTDRVRQIADHPETAGARAPYVVRFDGKLYVINGHHRIAAAAYSGDATVPVALIDMDPVPAQVGVRTGKAITGDGAKARTMIPTVAELIDKGMTADAAATEWKRLYYNARFRVRRARIAAEKKAAAEKAKEVSGVPVGNEPGDWTDPLGRTVLPKPDSGMYDLHQFWLLRDFNARFGLRMNDGTAHTYARFSGLDKDGKATFLVTEDPLAYGDPITVDDFHGIADVMIPQSMYLQMGGSVDAAIEAMAAEVAADQQAGLDKPTAIYTLPANAVNALLLVGRQPGPGRVRMNAWTAAAQSLQEGETLPVVGYTHHGHTVDHGTVTRRDGMLMLVEHAAGDDPTPKFDVIARSMERALGGVKPSRREHLRGIAWLAGQYPEDITMSKKLGKPFRSAATGGQHGQIEFWDYTPDPATLAHEFGHVVDSEGATGHQWLTDDGTLPAPPPDTDPDTLYAGKTWTDTQDVDRQYRARLREVGGKWYEHFTEIRKAATDHSIALGTAAPSVYGDTNSREDFAESVRLYLKDRRYGKLGYIPNPAGGSVGINVTFRDLWPNRAKFLDTVFGNAEPGQTEWQKQRIAAYVEAHKMDNAPRPPSDIALLLAVDLPTAADVATQVQKAHEAHLKFLAEEAAKKAAEEAAKAAAEQAAKAQAEAAKKAAEEAAGKAAADAADAAMKADEAKAAADALKRQIADQQAEFKGAIDIIRQQVEADVTANSMPDSVVKKIAAGRKRVFARLMKPMPKTLKSARGMKNIPAGTPVTYTTMTKFPEGSPLRLGPESGAGPMGYGKYQVRGVYQGRDGTLNSWQTFGKYSYVKIANVEIQHPTTGMWYRGVKTDAGLTTWVLANGEPSDVLYTPAVYQMVDGGDGATFDLGGKTWDDAYAAANEWEAQQIDEWLTEARANAVIEAATKQGLISEGAASGPFVRKNATAAADLLKIAGTWQTKSPYNTHQYVDRSMQAKANLMAEIAHRLSSDEDWAMFVEYRRGLEALGPQHRRADFQESVPAVAALEQVTDPAEKKEIMEKEVRNRIAQWASSAGDNNPWAVMMQRAIQAELGVPGHWAPRAGGGYSGEEIWGQIDKAWPVVEPFYRRFIRAQYEHTQDTFKKHDIKYVSLYRGMSALPPGHGAGVNPDGIPGLQPANSWAARKATAKSFGGSYLLTADFPVERILGSALTGFGCLNEWEYVVVNGPGNVTVYSSAYDAPQGFKLANAA